MPFAFFHKITGELLSTSSELPTTELAANIGVVNVTEDQVDQRKNMWDPVMRTFVPRPAEPPPRDRIDDFLKESFIGNLRVADRDAMQAALLRHFGDVRTD